MLESLASELVRLVDRATLELRAIDDVIAASKPGPDVLLKRLH